MFRWWRRVWLPTTGTPLCSAPAHRRGERVEGLVHDAVVRPLTALLAGDQPDVDELLEMVRDGRLREPDRAGELADAGFPRRVCRDEGKQPYPSRVGEGLEDPCQSPRGVDVENSAGQRATTGIEGAARRGHGSRGHGVSLSYILTPVDVSSMLDTSNYVDGI